MRDAGSRMWDTASLRENGSVTTGRYVYENKGGGDLFGVRAGFRVDTYSLGSGSQWKIVRMHKDGTDIMSVYLYNNGGDLEIKVTVWDSGSTERTVGSNIGISSGTNYQILLKWDRNQANGAAFEVWQENGTTQVGSTREVLHEVTPILASPAHLLCRGPRTSYD